MGDAAPVVVPLDAQRRSFFGYVRAGERECRVSFSVGAGDVVDVDSLCMDEHVARDVADGALLRARLRSAAKDGGVDAFVSELQAALAVSGGARGAQAHRPRAVLSAEQCRLRIAHLRAAGMDRVESLSDSFDEVVLREQDRAGRAHHLRLHLPEGYPEEAASVLGASLPEAFSLRWSRDEGLAGALRQFRAALDRYADVWDCLDDIDAHCWVLEPEQPTRSDLQRRVALASHAALVFRVDPRQPRALPQDLQFMGPAAVVDPLRSRLNKRLRGWSTARTPRANLEALLELTFPSPQESAKEDFAAECGICYAYKLGEHVPDAFCDNPQCRRAYHASCLYEWLHALPTSKISFETLFGDCPYCGQVLSVKAR